MFNNLCIMYYVLYATARHYYTLIVYISVLHVYVAQVSNFVKKVQTPFDFPCYMKLFSMRKSNYCLRNECNLYICY